MSAIYSEILQKIAMYPGAEGKVLERMGRKVNSGEMEVADKRGFFRPILTTFE